MKIAFFIQDFRGGGAQHMIVNTANEFAKRGHDVTLLVVSDAGPHRKKVAANVKIANLGKTRSLTALWAMARYIRAAKPDILLSAMTHSNIVAILSRFLAPSSPVKLVITERTFLSAHLKETPSRRDKLSLIGVRLLYRFADKIVGISEGVAGDIARLGRLKNEQVGYIYNPVITPEIRSEFDKIPPSPRSAEPLIITSGRLSFEKDQATLITALAILRKTVNARLVLLGDGPLKKDLQEQAKKLGVEDHVQFAGFVPDSLARMKQADLFVITSLYEGFCNTIVEALYCGLPVVSTDCPSGPREILERGLYGRLVPVGDADKLAEAMAQTLNEPRDPGRQRERAMAFTVEKICDRYETLFRDLVK